MDLGTCPKCGRAWQVGSRHCGSCGFVAIGAGIRAKKKQKKRYRYIEPGNSGWLFGAALLFAGVGLGITQPWVDGGQKLKQLFGIASDSVVGDWEVRKSIRLSKTAPAIIAVSEVETAIFSFKKNGSFTLSMDMSKKNAQASGRYLVENGKLRLYPQKGSMKLPSEVQLQLNWLSNDSFQAVRADKEMLLIQKLNSKAKLARMWKMNMTSTTGAVQGLVEDSGQ